MYLLTGGSGILGTELQKQALTYGIHFMAPPSDELNILEEEYVQSYLRRHPDLFGKVHTIVHCAAYTDVPGAERQRFDAMYHNIDGTANVRSLAQILDASMVYISTDYVYPGRDGNYRETDFTQPINFYALTKLAGETWVDGPDDLIIRTSFKPNVPWPYPKAFDDLYTSADYVDVIAPKILDLIGNQQRGVYNVGTERKSIYELARRRTTKVKPMSIKEIKDVHLPSDISMNLDKFNDYYDEQYGCDAPDCCPEQ